MDTSKKRELETQFRELRWVTATSGRLKGSAYQARERLCSRKKQLTKQIFRSFDDWRREFCAQFSAVLPREVRDMVYNELLLDTTNRFAKERYVGQPPQQELGHIRDLRPPKPGLVKKSAQVFSPGKVGPIVSAEMAQAAYGKVLFIIDDPSEIPRILTHRVFGLELEPYDHIRNVRIYNPDYSSGDDNTTDYAHLFQIRNMSVLKVELVVISHTVTQLKVDLKAMAPTVLSLIKARAKVAILCLHDQYDSLGQWEGIEVIDHTSIFQGTAEECIGKIENAEQRKDLGVYVWKEVEDIVDMEGRIWDKAKKLPLIRGLVTILFQT